MISQKKEFYTGVSLLAAFIVVLFIIFSPVFNGQNGLEFLDDLYNSISKGSAYYIPKIKQETAAFSGETIHVSLEMKSDLQAEQTALLFMKSGAMINTTGKEVKVNGDLGQILANCLSDADAMYVNNGRALTEKYGYNEKQALFNWWHALNAMDKELKKQKQFRKAKAVHLVVTKAVESAYNYYGVDPQKISDRFGVVLFSLVFYVVYTLWYGFSIMYMFTGIGLKLEH